MTLLFWISFSLVAYAYVGYPCLLWILSKVHSVPVLTGPEQPTVSVVIAARNEAQHLPRKISNLLQQNYPKERVEIVIVSDGSTDATAELLTGFHHQVRAILLPESLGKASALNCGVTAATGDILLFLDARQSLDVQSLCNLVPYFADPSVGAVSGELHLETQEGLPSPEGLGIYWKIEKVVRQLESATGSVVGVTGAIFAMRRSLFQPLPSGTLLDDVLTPMRVARAGYRVLFCGKAVARDRLFDQRGKEFGRKVRTLTGNYQLLQLAPWLLSLRNPLLFRFCSHKLLRLLVPGFLALMLLASATAHGVLYSVLFCLQLLVYALALLGRLWPTSRQLRPIAIPYTFVLLNAAAAVAFYNFVTGRARWT